MANSPYLLRRSTVVLIRDMRGYKLRELPAGAVFHPTGSKPDSNRMIDGTCKGAVILMFLRDLEERAEPIAATLAKRSGKVQASLAGNIS